MRTEVILLLYNRPGHSLRVLESLIQAGVPHVRAFLDHSDDAGVQRAQEELLARFAERKEISVTLHRHTRRLGLARSVRFALDSVLSDADAAIVLEDDCVVRPGGIDFFREGLSALRYERRIRSLCGYLFPCSFIRSASEPLLLRRFSTWGWATWRDRWCDYEPDLARVLRRLGERGLVPADVAGDIAALCESKAYLENKADIWSVNWILEHYVTGTFCVYPCDSMIDNIGFDGTGNNCEPTHAFRTAAAEQSEKAWNFKQLFHCVENEELLKRFMSDHGLKTYPRS